MCISSFSFPEMIFFQLFHISFLFHLLHHFHLCCPVMFHFPSFYFRSCSYISLPFLISHLPSFSCLSHIFHFHSFHVLTYLPLWPHFFFLFTCSFLKIDFVFISGLTSVPPLMPYFLSSQFPSPNYHNSTHSESNKRLMQMMCGLSDMLLWCEREEERERECSVQLEGAFSARFCPFREYDITHREFPAACIFGHNVPRRAWQTARNTEDSGFLWRRTFQCHINTSGHMHTTESHRLWWTDWWVGYNAVHSGRW